MARDSQEVRIFAALSDLRGTCCVRECFVRTVGGEALFDHWELKVTVFCTFLRMVLDQPVGAGQPSAALGEFTAKHQGEPDPEAATRCGSFASVPEMLFEGPLVVPNEFLLAPKHVGGFPEALELGAVKFTAAVSV
ncbi:hypothetical protein NKH84_15120 [Mesorhizobium sp. M0902]|uniref:hypothetical protein n=1 Tax=unclassified Mesorhizobium TaxID=325217 RepID=UPI00333C9C31